MHDPVNPHRHSYCTQLEPYALRRVLIDKLVRSTFFVFSTTGKLWCGARFSYFWVATHNSQSDWTAFGKCSMTYTRMRSDKLSCGQHLCSAITYHIHVAWHICRLLKHTFSGISRMQLRVAGLDMTIDRYKIQMHFNPNPDYRKLDLFGLHILWFCSSHTKIVINYRI